MFIHLDDPSEIARLKFSDPEFCLFKGEDDANFNEGIAYHDEIIYLCCGVAIPLNKCTEIEYRADGVWPTIEVFG